MGKIIWKGDSVKENNNIITNYITSKKEEACKVIDIILQELSKPEKIADASFSQLTSVMSTLIDKFGADEKDVSQDGLISQIFSDFKDVK